VLCRGPSAAHLLLSRGIAVLAGALFAVSLGLHVAALAGVDVREYWPGVFWLHAVVIAAPLSVVLSPAGRRHRDLYEALPRWGARLIQVVFAYAIVNFVLYAIQSHGGGPGIEDGRYVLSRHGDVLRFLTEEDWHGYRALQLRGVSGHWMLFSLLAALVWAKEARATGRRPRGTATEPPITTRRL